MGSAHINHIDINPCGIFDMFLAELDMCKHSICPLRGESAGFISYRSRMQRGYIEFAFRQIYRVDVSQHIDL